MALILDGTTGISTTGNITGNNIVGNLTVTVVSASGNITGGNLSVTGNTVINGDLTVTGNASLSGNIVGDRIVNGTTEISVQTTNGNANVTVGGTSNVAVFTTTGINVTGVVSATGNITGGNILGGANVNATTHTGATVSVTSNVTGGNINTGGVVSATGNIIGGNLSGTSIVGTLTTASQTNITGVGNITTGTWSATAVGLAYGGTGKTTAPAAMAALMGYTSTVTAAGTTTLTNTSSYYQQFTGSTTQTVVLPVTSTLQTGWTFHIVNNSTGNVTVQSSGLNTVITVIAGTTAMVTCIGTALTTAADWESGLTDFSTYTGTGAVVLGTSPTLTTPSIGAATGTSISVTANVTGGNLVTGGAISAIGNIIGGNLIVTGIVVDNTANLDLQSTATNGNINLIPAGTGNVYTGANLIVTGLVSATTHTGTTVSVTGNITGGNILGGANVNATTHTGTTVSVSGVITGGTLSSTGNVNTVGVAATGNISTTGNVSAGTHIGTAVSVTANVTGGNLTTGGQVTATGNILTAANLVATNFVEATRGLISASNYNGGYIDGIVVDYLTGNGRISMGNADGLIIYGNGVADTTLVTISPVGAVTAQGFVSAVGNITTTANVSGGNVLVGGQVSAVGNVTGGNVNTNKVVGTGLTLSSTGNITFSTTGNIDANNEYINNVPTPVQDGDAVNKLYVDNFVTGLNVHDAVKAATPTTLATITGGTITYNNGTDGVGATLTTTGAFNLIDTVNVQTSGTRILVLNEANAVTNGVYVWSNATAITRASDYNTVPEVEAGDFMFVTSGAQYGNTGWIQTSSPTGIGTAGNNITFTQFSGSGTYNAGTGLTLSGTTFSIANTAVTSGSYGSSSAIATFTVNQQGQLTAASTASINAPASLITGTTLSSNVTTSTLTSVGTLTSLTSSGNINTTGAISATGNISSAGNVSGGNLLAGTGSIIAGNANITGTTASTSKTTGALVVGGGLGVAGTAYTNRSVTQGAYGNIFLTEFVGIFAQKTNGATLIQATSNSLAQGMGFYTNDGAVPVVYSSGNIGFAVGSTIRDQDFPTGGTTPVTVASTGLYSTGVVSASGNISAPYFVGNGAALTGLSASKIYNGTSEANIGTSGGNANISIGGTANVFVVATTGIYTTGLSSVSGNITGGNITTAGTVTAATVNAAAIGNAGAVFTGASISAATIGNTSAVHNGASLSVTGAITGAGITGSSLTVSTGNISGGNINNNNVTGVGNIGTATVAFNTVFAKATSAQYADLAENYTADAAYNPGTILVFGGTHEVTIATVASDARVAGIVSTNPAHLMNSTLESEFVAAVALTGRVPASVVGTVRKGDMMVSAGNGAAMACATPAIGTVIGKAVENFNGESGVIEIVVGRL